MNRKLAILGAALKPDTDDVRDSPAHNVAAVLHLRGAEVLMIDPDLAHLAELAANPVVLDARNVLDAEVWSSAGWEVRPRGGRVVARQRRVLEGASLPT